MGENQDAEQRHLDAHAAPGAGEEEPHASPHASSTADYLKRKAAGKKKERKPWKDRIKDLGDAVIFLQVFPDPNYPVRRCLLLATASGTVSWLSVTTGGSQSLAAIRSVELQRSVRVCSMTSFASDLEVRAVKEQWGTVRNLEYGACHAPGVIFSGDDQGGILAWNAMHGENLTSLSGHSAAITHVRCLQEDTADLISASIDGSIRVWCTGTADAVHVGGQLSDSFCLYVLNFGSCNPVSDLVLLQTGSLVVTTWDGQLRIVEMSQPARCIKAVQVSAADSQIRSLCIWHYKDEAEPQYFLGLEDGSVTCWATSTALPTGAGLASLHDHGAFYRRLLWQAHACHVESLCMSNDWLVSASEDRSVRLWEAATGQRLADYYGHNGGVLSMCLDVAGKLLVTGSRDHSIRSWDLAEVEQRLHETAAMEMCDRESFQYEVHFSRLSPKERAKRLAESQKAAKAKANPKAKSKSRAR
eukprot:TRINITY_DN67202_c0_g1_i1.p1 TRINITY_DN67202_c0_g1~~TRINITY_DN67202_c0_g1_i1.p1  ORF type:complete len:489 (+),score=105.06 TRINITY_DN67202_c0_g1_i1:54-1469(+)